jgi:hypothetical protein
MRIEVQSDFFPRLTSWHVRKALKWINPSDLEGLGCIRILRYEPEDPAARNLPPYLNGFLYNGYYFREKVGRPATIALYTHDLYFPIPKIFVLSPVATLRIAERLAHELGHYVLATGRFSGEVKIQPKRANSHLVDPQEEAAADQYAAQVVNRMLRSTYYRFGRFMARWLSSRMFKLGDRAHWKGDFKRAAELEFRAYMLNHENEDAWQAYLQDKQALMTKTPSALNDAERRWLYHRR